MNTRCMPNPSAHPNCAHSLLPESLRYNGNAEECTHHQKALEHHCWLLQVDYDVAIMCETIKALMPTEEEEEEEENLSTTPIPLPAVEAQHLQLIIDWCKHELESKDVKEDLKKKWNTEFFQEKDDTTIFAIILVHFSAPASRARADLFSVRCAQGANYLDCKELLKAGVYHVAGILHKRESTQQMSPVA